MRRTFHRRRNDRYQIAIEELKSTFIQCGGEHVVDIADRDLNPRRSKAQRDVYRSLHKIKYALTESHLGYQKRHGIFLKHLRLALKALRSLDDLSYWQKSFRSLCSELCKTKFYRIHLFLFGHELLKNIFSSFTQAPKSQLDYNQHFSKYSFLDESNFILETQPAIYLERDIRKINETLTQTIFDPHSYNHPFLLYTFAFFRKGSLCKIKMVRMGSPTKETWSKNPSVIEEFSAFLEMLKQEGKNHLYVNKQRTWGKEGKRSCAIKCLENQYDNFYCVSLPSDGAFYYQQMSYQDEKKAEVFKKTFYDLLLGLTGKGYYHFPKKWVESKDFQEGIKEVLNQVHLLYFQNKEELSKEERRYFIDHAYTQIIIFCLQNYTIDSVNITCRDGIDRAGCEQTKLLYYFQASLCIEDELDSKIERQFLMHIPPYLAKSRPIVKERREYLYELFDATYNDEVRDRIFAQSKSSPLLYHKPHFAKRS